MTFNYGEVASTHRSLLHELRRGHDVALQGSITVFTVFRGGFLTMVGKLGKQLPKHDSRHLAMAAYLPPSFPPPPQTMDWTSRITDWGMMGNDAIGDCTIAAMGHAIQTWTAVHGTEANISTDLVTSYYSKWTGYSPDVPGSDNGAVLLDVLTDWRNEGFGAAPELMHKLIAFAAVQHKSVDSIKQAITLFGGVYLGLGLPLTAQDQSIWMLTDSNLAGPAAPYSWGGHCLAPGTRVLTADLRWVPVESLLVGQTLIGFDEFNQGIKRFYKPSVVTQVTPLELECYDLEFSDGSRIRCSYDHLWLCRDNTGVRKWVATEDMRAGTQRATHVCKPIEPWGSSNTWEWGYLSGAFDGEGYLSMHGKRLHKMGFCQRPNEMLKQVQQCLANLGFNLRAGVQRANGIGKQDCVYLMVRSKEQMMRLLGQARPPRLLAKFNPTMLQSIESPNRPRLLSKRKYGLHPVVAVGTTTRTFIAEGFASHNCVWCPRYDEEYLTCVTWGGLKKMSWAFLNAYSDEADCLIADDWLPYGHNLMGFQLADMLKDLQEVTR